MDREKAVRILTSEIRSLAVGAALAEDVAALFELCITEVEDGSLMDLAPDKVQVLIYAHLSELAATGKFEFYNRNGELIDDAKRMQKLAQLLEDRK